MPKFEGVYRDAGGWYFKVRISQDPLTKKWRQVTRRGFTSALEASQARRDFLGGDAPPTVAAGSMSIAELTRLCLADAESSGALSAKTLFDYRHYLDVYIEPHLGGQPVRDVTPEMIARWQQRLSENGAKRSGKPLSANTIRLARAPLAGTAYLKDETPSGCARRSERVGDRDRHMVLFRLARGWTYRGTPRVCRSSGGGEDWGPAFMER